MSTFNPSKARQDWQDFKKKNPSVEKLRNYPKGIGNLLDKSEKNMQLAKAAGDDFRKCLASLDRYDQKKREKIYQIYSKALEDVLSHFTEITKKFKAMEDLIKSSAAKDPTLKSALTDWSSFSSKVCAPQSTHQNYVSQLYHKARDDHNNLKSGFDRLEKHFSKATKEPPEKSGGVLLKEWLGRPYKIYVSAKAYAEIKKAMDKWDDEAIKLQQQSIYKF